MDFEVRNEPQRADFCFTIGSSESGKSLVSAEKKSEKWWKMVLVIMDLRWDTSVEVVEFPIRIRFYSEGVL
jgi:hypothetical protein